MFAGALTAPLTLDYSFIFRLNEGIVVRVLDVASGARAYRSPMLGNFQNHAFMMTGATFQVGA